MPRYAVMAQLGSVLDGLTTTELAERLSVTRASITSLANGLEGKGLVARLSNERRPKMHS